MNNPLARGYHYFQVGPTGINCCIYCGAYPYELGDVLKAFKALTRLAETAIRNDPALLAEIKRQKSRGRN